MPEDQPDEKYEEYELLPNKKHSAIVNGERQDLEPGDKVRLTPGQAQAFGDKFKKVGGDDGPVGNSPPPAPANADPNASNVASVDPIGSSGVGAPAHGTPAPGVPAPAATQTAPVPAAAQGQTQVPTQQPQTASSAGGGSGS